MSGTPLQGSPFSEIEKLRGLVGKRFTIYETRTTPYSLIFMVNIDQSKMENSFNDLAEEMWPLFYVPFLRVEGGEHLIEVVRRPTRKTYGGIANWILLLLTLTTTLFAGAFFYLDYSGGTVFRYSDLLWGGLLFALPLLAILGLHELAHYFTARRHHIEASLPFFMPMPPPFVPFGTMGAFISLRQPITNKKALFDIGVSGPMAGFAVAIPVTIAGLYLSRFSPVLPLTNCGPVILSVPYGNLVFGPSAIFYLLSLFFPVTTGNMNPLAIAGWVGLLVTAINLLPAGQLDGGHVFRSLLGKNSVWLSMAAVVVLLALSLFYIGWILFAFLILLLGVRHPPPLNDLSPLDTRRKLIGVGAAIVLVGGFMIVPISDATGAYASHQDVMVTPFNNQSTNVTISFYIADQDIVSHAYSLTMSVSPKNLTNQTLSTYESEFNWTITYKSSLGSGHTSGTGLNLSLAQVNATGGGRAEVVITAVDPIPAHFILEVKPVEACTSVQNLQSDPTFYIPY